jgi:hypothetical protein
MSKAPPEPEQYESEAPTYLMYRWMMEKGVAQYHPESDDEEAEDEQDSA